MEPPPSPSTAAEPSAQPDSTTDTPLSKNAQKKAAKAARFAAQKLERRAREKEAKKEKKRVRAEKRAAGELDDEEEEQRAKKKRAKVSKPFGGKVVVDLGFDEMMTDKEIVSLTSQLAYTYSANRRSSSPFSSVLFTSLNGRTFTRLEGMNEAGYKRWSHTEWWKEGYERLWAGEVSEEAQQKAKESVVYLTADTDEELMELKEDETYIIGGICDHNRYKNLCLNKAKESGIRVARLPIGRYLAQLQTRKVLTVNQVFEILLRWVETRDWQEALYAVMPKRKFQGAGKDRDGATSEGEDEGSDQAIREVADLNRDADNPPTSQGEVDSTVPTTTEGPQ